MRRTREERAGCLLLVALFLAGFLHPPLLDGADGGMRKPAAKDKCPVCGMFVTKYPDWLAAACLKDGRCLFFDGPKDLFKYLQEPQRYDPTRKREDIVSATVLDYYRLTPLDVKKGWYVLGSDVYGPMGRELIPLEKEAEAREFLKDHKGTKIIRYPEVTPEVIKSLD